jgi:hypothetical protein
MNWPLAKAESTKLTLEETILKITNEHHINFMRALFSPQELLTRIQL